MKTSAPFCKNLIAICAAALLAASSAGSAAAEEGDEWSIVMETGGLECSGCGDGESFRGQVLATSNPNKVIEITSPIEGGLVGRYTPLTAAAEWGDVKDIKALLARGANVNLRDPDGYTPLLRTRSTENIKVLLANGADANARDPDGRTSLIRVGWGDKEAVELLLASGADVNAASYWGDTALSGALENKENDAIRALQAAGAKENPIAEGAADVLGNTALMLAARSGDTKEMQHLIDVGADVNAANQAGNTALMIAAYSNKTGAAKLLLDKGANANTANRKGETALIHPLWRVDSENMLKLLLKKGANANAANGKGETVLMRAAGYGNSDAVMLLLANGANVHAKDKEGHTALDHVYMNVLGDTTESQEKIIAALQKAAKKSSGKRK